MSVRAPRMLFRSVALLAALAVAGCAYLPGGRAPAPDPSIAVGLPPWYLTPPEDTESALYGVGSASTLPAAKSAGLVDVASKLVISVRATQRDLTVLHNDQLDQHIESELVSNVRDAEFQNYEALESALSEGVYYALVRVDRSRLVLDTLEGLRERERELDARLTAVEPGASLAYYMAFRDVEPALAKAEADAELLSVLADEFDPAPYVERHRAYRERFEEARAEMVLALVPDAASAQVTQVVQELLSRAGVQSEVVATPAGTLDACRELCVEITTAWSSRYAVRRYMAFLTATFSVRDAAGGVASARQHRVHATALSGDAQAQLAAVEKLRAELEREGILRAVGFTPDATAGLVQTSLPD